MQRLQKIRCVCLRERKKEKMREKVRERDKAHVCVCVSVCLHVCVYVPDIFYLFYDSLLDCYVFWCLM